MIRILLIFLSIPALAHGQRSKEAIKLKFERHFKTLDSLASISKNEMIENGYYSISFMEKATGIEAKTGGNYIGKFDCYKSDLYKWHQWYEHHYFRKKMLKKTIKI